MMRRIRYNRASIEDTISAAQRIVSGTDEARYIYATSLGFAIDTEPPAFRTMRYVKVTQQAVEKFEPELR